MPVVKKRDYQTETRLLLEATEPVTLPAADVSESALLVQFDQYKPYLGELLDELRNGTTVEPVPVMNDESTFAIHGPTRTFWVKIWHLAGTDRSRIERVQVMSCLPSTRGVRVVVNPPEE
jgi:hypothetical protein